MKMLKDKSSNSNKNIVIWLLIFLNTTFLFSYEESVSSKAIAKVEKNTLIYYIDIHNISKDKIIMNLGGWFIEGRFKSFDDTYRVFLSSDNPINNISFFEIKTQFNDLNFKKKYFNYESRDSFNQQNHFNNIPFFLDSGYAPKIIQIDKNEKIKLKITMINFKSLNLITKNDYATNIILSYAKFNTLNKNQIDIINNIVMNNEYKKKENLSIDYNKIKSKNDMFPSFQLFYPLLNTNVKMNKDIENILKTKFYWKKTMRCIIEVPKK